MHASLAQRQAMAGERLAQPVARLRAATAQVGVEVAEVVDREHRVAQSTP